MVSSEPLLSDLCTICHTSIPKYTCPRCATRTCSLPCCKKHKQRATCSGVRDPTAFVPRSKIATPAGVDHDYNFLSGIERGVGRMEDDVDRRREERAKASSGVPNAKARGERFVERIAETRVVVHKAPVGMARQRANRTRWVKKDRVFIWTVEWVHDDASKSLDHDVRDTRPLAEAYFQHFRELRNKRARGEDGAPPQPESRKRRRKVFAQVDGAADESSLCAENRHEDQPQPHDAQDSTAISDSPSTDTNGSNTTTSQAQTRTPSSAPQKKPVSTDKHHHFYLHRPHTFGTDTILIPLDRTSTLHTLLASRTILEYPTIYALLQPPDALPSGYVLESDYLQQLEKVRREADEMFAGAEDRGAQVDGSVREAEEVVDERRLLDVLRRDVGGAAA
ncbi:hypothetical protein EJ05DRAFT_507336 [Pseudovirgaria hyperparasitica]|uniref:Box C/D snoRNA protein 1 n=1 Tax=Pseudovirgaria hyperparasitica TaxID=470096 RepID=A0A6A6WI79_9PEZI|nr:uncharacterized protein EJ05DRAFT_507336 [Pseudovirgaria hyperparasitica]KAF2761696.1 hypothetical protein EJ05DRAFT_507336 [Pseudovirgaria hyperparasitica]